MATGKAGFDSHVDLIGNRVAFIQDKKQMRSMFARELGLAVGRRAGHGDGHASQKTLR